MGGAFFVSRTDLLNWLNDVLKLNYTDLNQASNGAAFCQIIDAIHQGVGLQSVLIFQIIYVTSL